MRLRLLSDNMPRQEWLLGRSAGGRLHAVSAATSTFVVDNLFERGELRSQWLRDTELTGGVRGRDAYPDHEVDVERRRQLQY